jgi:glycosyltransferase involved in cell wall biosynthesis
MVATDLADPNKRILEGARVFLRALDENQAEGKLILIGGASEKIKLKDGRLVLLGTRTPQEIADILPAADFLMSASDVESAGMTIAEAGASGVPSVIIDNGSGVGEMIVNDLTGIEARNWEDFEKSVNLLVSQPELSRKMSVEASGFANRTFHPERISAEYLRLYETGA